MSEPLTEPPAEPEGDDTVNKPDDDTETVTIVDFEPAKQLDEEDITDDKVDGDDV